MYTIKNGVQSKSFAQTHKNVIAALIIGFAMVLAGGMNFAHAGGKNDNKQIVAGTTPPCAMVIASDGTSSLSARTEADGSTAYYATPLTLKGSLSNCSTSLQAYNIEFSEVVNGSVDTLGQNSCIIGFGSGAWSVGDFLMKSGENRGWSFTNELTGVGIVDPTTCLGAHTVAVKVVDRTTGATLSTSTTSYTVTLK